MPTPADADGRSPRSRLSLDFLLSSLLDFPGGGALLDLPAGGGRRGAASASCCSCSAETDKESPEEGNAGAPPPETLSAFINSLLRICLGDAGLDAFRDDTREETMEGAGDMDREDGGGGVTSLPKDAAVRLAGSPSEAEPSSP